MQPFLDQLADIGAIRTLDAELCRMEAEAAPDAPWRTAPLPLPQPRTSWQQQRASSSGANATVTETSEGTEEITMLTTNHGDLVQV